MNPRRRSTQIWTAGLLSRFVLITANAQQSGRGLPHSIKSFLRPLSSVLSTITLLAIAPAAFADTHYVAITSTNPVSPYITWETAATNIQDAIDVSISNDTVLVSNGVYATGGRVVYGAMTNRVAITNAITLRSINGPAFTMIAGAKEPITTNGDSAVRCAYVATNCVLSGFKLSDGATRNSGDSIREKCGGGVFCAGGVISNCVISDNASAYGGGGANSDGGRLYNCTMSGNFARYGGGASAGRLFNCTICGNTASLEGGGANFAFLYNCIVYGNAASSNNNYLYSTFAYSCTTPQPGGIGNITNDPQFVDTANSNFHLKASSPCINAGNNAYATNSTTDLDGRPRIVADIVDMGAYEYGYHFVAIASTNPVPPYSSWATAATNIQDAIDISVSNDTVLVSNGVYATGGRTVNEWSLTNRVAVTNAITLQSINGPESTIIMGAGPNGLSAVRCVYLGADATLSGFTLTNGSTLSFPTTDYYKNCNGGGIKCETSASSVVTNCILSGNSASYSGGSSDFGTFHNCVISDSSSERMGGGSNNGTLNSCIFMRNSSEWFGGGASSCVLNNCLLIGNYASLQGGGAMGGILNDCRIIANSGSSGGGVVSGTLKGCILVGNYAKHAGGAALGSQITNCFLLGNMAADGGASWQADLYNSTLAGNVATNSGGGSMYGMLKNCIVYSNVASSSPNHTNCYIIYSCTFPMPTNGTGNITNDPQFVDAANSNFHLLATSPCIDRGDNAYATNLVTDLDGNPRIMFGTVDMGAYEYQLPVGYWQWVGAITNGQTNLADSATGDGYPNLLKYATGSSPTNSDDLAAMDGSQRSNGLFALVFNRNTNASDVSLIVEGSNDATNDAPWSGIATNILGSWGGAMNVSESGTSTPVVVTVQDTAALATNRFLRLRVTRP